MPDTDDTTTPFVSANSSAAARLLEMAANNADQLVAEAKAEASALVSAAHADADRQMTASQAEADQLLAAARDEAKRVTDEVELHRAEQTEELGRLRATALADLADEKAHLATSVERLRELERDLVGRMRTYLTEELEHLEQLHPISDVAAVSDSPAA